jgi:hypothetical protein
MSESTENKADNNEIKRVSFGRLLKDLISGSIVTDRIILKNLGYMALLTLLGALYIANRFHAERITRDTTRIQNELKDLRAESMATSTDLVYASKQSEVYRLVKERGLDLEELSEPPFKLIVSKK